MFLINREIELRVLFSRRTVTLHGKAVNIYISLQHKLKAFLLLSFVLASEENSVTFSVSVYNEIGWRFAQHASPSVENTSLSVVLILPIPVLVIIYP